LEKSGKLSGVKWGKGEFRGGEVGQARR